MLAKETVRLYKEIAHVSYEVAKTAQSNVWTFCLRTDWLTHWHTEQLLNPTACMRVWGNDLINPYRTSIDVSGIHVRDQHVAPLTYFVMRYRQLNHRSISAVGSQATSNFQDLHKASSTSDLEGLQIDRQVVMPSRIDNWQYKQVEGKCLGHLKLPGLILVGRQWGTPNVLSWFTLVGR